jgi:hypothetical protein
VTAEQIAEFIVAEIVRDLRSRSGLENAWDEIDVDVRNEIWQKWRQLAADNIKRLS